MNVLNLGESNSVLNSYIAEMRDINIQKDRLRFRTNLERVGRIFAYEISRTLDYSVKEVTTPLGIATVSTPDTPLVIASILRSGLPLQKGILDCFDRAETAFVAAYRKYGKGDYFELRTDYCICPDITGKTLILSDTMLATGASIELVYNTLIEEGGTPQKTHFVCPIASAYAVEYLQKHLADNVTLWTAAIDEELTGHSYIVPGIGDAGDLAFGGKI